MEIERGTDGSPETLATDIYFQYGSHQEFQELMGLPCSILLAVLFSLMFFAFQILCVQLDLVDATPLWALYVLYWVRKDHSGGVRLAGAAAGFYSAAIGV